MLRSFIYCLVVLLCIGNVSLAQKNIFADARWDLELAAGTAVPLGSTHSSDGKVNLLSNMGSGLSYNLRLMRFIEKQFSIGGSVGVTKFENWSSPGNNLYQNASAKFLFVGPSVMYKGWPAKRNANLSLIVSPGISQVSIRTASDSEINGMPTAVPLSVSSVRFTLAANAGMQYLFSDSFGLTLNVGYQRTFAKSKVFADKNFDFLSVQPGVLLRLSKNKKYKYKDL